MPSKALKFHRTLWSSLFDSEQMRAPAPARQGDGDGLPYDCRREFNAIKGFCDTAGLPLWRGITRAVWNSSDVNRAGVAPTSTKRGRYEHAKQSAERKAYMF